MTEKRSEEVDFSGLVAGLAASALAVLSQVEGLVQPPAAETRTESEEGTSGPLSQEELEKRVAEGLAGARRLIDTLAVLEEKTRGNLTADEEQLLQSSLSELRISFVAIANRPLPRVDELEGGSE